MPLAKALTRLSSDSDILATERVAFAHVAEHVRNQRGLHAFLTLNLCEFTEGDLQIHQQLRWSILCLRPALCVEPGFDGRGIDVRHTVGVSIDDGFASVLALAGEGGWGLVGALWFLLGFDCCGALTGG